MEKISKIFPHVSSTSVVELQLDLGMVGRSDVQHKSVGTQWSFVKTAVGTAQVILQPTFISLEYGPGDYESFQAFSDEFNFVIDQLGTSFELFPLDRIGLRYFNEIRLPGKALDWSGMVRDELVTSVLAPAVTGGRLLRSMHQVVELHGEDQVLFN